MTPRRRAIGRMAIALGVAAIVVVAAVAILAVTSTPSNSTTTPPTSTPQDSTTSSASPGTGSGSPNASLVATLMTKCSEAQSSNPATIVEATKTTAAVICLQYYYYNTTAPLTLNLTNGLKIQALQYISNGSTSYPGTFNGASNFTVMASQNQLVIGGPSNENEGVTVAFAIIAKTGASGTYQINFPGICSGCSTAWKLTPTEPLNCGYYLELTTGNGQPNYAQLVDMCITYLTYNSSTSSTTETSTTSYHTLSGIQYPLYNQWLYFRITATTNSTQTGSVG